MWALISYRALDGHILGVGCTDALWDIQWKKSIGYLCVGVVMQARDLQ